MNESCNTTLPPFLLTGIARESEWVGTRDYSALLCIPEALRFVSRELGGLQALLQQNHGQAWWAAEMLARAWHTFIGAPKKMCSAMAMVGLPADCRVKSEDDAKHLRCLAANGETWPSEQAKFFSEVPPGL